MQSPVTLERLERLKKAESAMYFHLEKMLLKGTYTREEQELVDRLLDLGKHQLEAEFSWFEYDLMRAPHEVHCLEGIIEQWDQIPPSKRPAITREAVMDRLKNLRKDISQKEAAVEKAKKEGNFWSIVPLLNFFDLPEEERINMSCYPLLPYFMQQAYTRMQTPRQPRSGLIGRWIGSIRRLRFAVSDRGGEVEVERYEPKNPGHK